MSVTRSPFSKNAPRKNSGYSFDENGDPIFVKPDGTIIRLVSGGQKKSSDKSTFSEERSAMDSELRKSIASAKLNPALNALEKIKAAEDAQRLAQGQATKNTSSLGMIGNIAKKVAAVPFAGVAGAFNLYDKIISPVQQVGNAALHELFDAAAIAWKGSDATWTAKELSLPYKPRVSWRDFVKQAKTKDFNVFGGKSGWNSPSLGWYGPVARFAADALFDPINYVTLPAGAVSRAARFATANRFATKEMLTKYPQLVPKLSNIARYGPVEIPAEIAKAEGISRGIAFFGKELPFTSGVAKAWRYSLAPVRAGVGDVLEKTTLGKGLLRGTAPESLKPLVAAGFGRAAAQNTYSPEFIRGLADLAANDVAQGGRVLFTHEGLAGIADTIDDYRSRGFTPEQMSSIIRGIEEPNFLATLDPELQDLATQYKQWEKDLYARGNEIRRKVADDYGIAVEQLRTIDNHIYHKLTDQAKKFMTSETGKKYGFTAQDLTAKDLIEGSGTASFRKYRAPEYDEAGNLISQSEFMGEKIMRGTIEEMNEIFRRKAGVDFDFFETELGTIAQGYAESVARIVGRARYVDELMKYGPDAIKGIPRKVVRDAELVTELEGINTALLAERKRLVSRVRRKYGLAGTKNAVASSAEDVVKLARQVLDGVLMQKEEIAGETAYATAGLDAIMNRIEKARQLATQKSAEARGEFDDIWIGLLNEAEALRGALVKGDSERLMATRALREEYIRLYGDDVPLGELDDKSAEWFAEKILRESGDFESIGKEQAILRKRREYLTARLDELPASEETVATRKALETRLADIDEQLEAAQIIADRRIEASYADDGVIWGSVEMPGDEVPFQMFTTKPVDDEFGTFFRMEDSIMGIAVPEEELVDLRVPEQMLAFLDEDSIATYFDNAWGELGIQDPMWRSVVADAFATGQVDETFTQISPAKSALIQEVIDFRNRILSNVDDDGELLELSLPEVESFFGWMRTINQHIVGEISPDNSDAVAGQVLNSVYAQITEDAAESGLRGALVPMSSLFPDLPNTRGEWSVLFPKDMPTPAVGTSYVDEWQFVNGNALAESIYKGTQESYVLDLINKGDSIKTDGLDLEALELTRKELEDELSKAIPDPTFAELERAKAADVVNINGKDIPATEARKRLAEIEPTLKAEYDRVQADIKRTIENEFGPEGYLEGLRFNHEERLAYLMDGASALKNWEDGVGVRMAQEIDDIVKVLERRPGQGSTAASNAAWVRETEKMFESLEALNEFPEVKAATEKLFTMLKADEIALSKIDDAIAENAFKLSEADAGKIGKIIADNVERGWTELQGMGVMVPNELAEKWGPNLMRLRNTEESQALWKLWQTAHNYWKKTVTASVGFFVRNGFSATFMNSVDGVTAKHIAEGFKWAVAMRDSKGKRRAGKSFLDWMERAGVTDEDEARKVFEIVAAAGRGVSDDFAIPSLGVSNKAGQPIRRAYNGYIGFFARKNDFVENMVRLPMALDSVRRGDTFAEAVARIRRVHFDYSDLSSLDKVMRRVVPFWIWTSRNIPLQIASISFRPQAYYQYEKIKQANPVNPDLIVPKWISDIGPVGAGAGAVLTPDLPHVRLAKSIKDMGTVTGLLGQATPVLKVPVETWIAKRQLGIDVGPFGEDKAVNGFVDKTLAKFFEETTGSWLTTRDPKTGQLLMDPRVIYTLEQFIPPLAQAFRLSGGRIGGKETLQERWISSIANWFGVPLRQIGEQQMRSEVIRRRYELEDFQKMLEQIKLQEQGQR